VQLLRPRLQLGRQLADRRHMIAHRDGGLLHAILRRKAIAMASAAAHGGTLWEGLNTENATAAGILARPPWMAYG
jgi:hypothetical protein